MSNNRICLIGAGSAAFGPSMFNDLYLADSLEGSRIVLCDIDEEKLEMVYELLVAENERCGNKFYIERTTDRTAALENADFVISSVEVDRFRFRWQDHKIPLKHGAKTRMGECGGPGGFFHSARIIPLVVEIARDVERICPNALFINYSNPMSRVCLAIKRATGIKVIGLCHQIGFFNHHLPKMLDMPLEDLKMTVTGLNHFGFLIGLEDFKTGKDLLSVFDEKCPAYFKDKWNRFEFSDLTFEVYKRFGYFPHAGDNHLCEYLQFGDEYTKIQDIKDWITLMEQYGEGTNKRMLKYYNKLKNVEEPYRKSQQGKLPEKGMLSLSPSGERAIPIIEAIINDKDSYESSVNIPNDSLVDNLPQDLIIESPATVDKGGVQGVKIGNLPRNIAALLRIEASIQDLCVDAVLKESKDLALACLAMDTKVGSFKMAENIFNEITEIQKGYLPDFK